MKVTQSYPTLCELTDYIVPGILQARILEWVAFPFSRGSSQPTDWTQVSHIAGRLFTNWATRYSEWPPNTVLRTAMVFLNYAWKKSKILGFEIQISTFSTFFSSLFLLKLLFLSKIHHFQKKTLHLPQCSLSCWPLVFLVQPVSRLGVYVSSPYWSISYLQAGIIICFISVFPSVPLL